jgi:GNAT superfamily N-acetyltransferase
VKVRQSFTPVLCLQRSEGMTVRVKIRIDNSKSTSAPLREGSFILGLNEELKEMNRIQFSMTKAFSTAELERLFLAVGWESGKYPEKLRIAMSNSDKVISAWDGERLVRLMSALCDGAMTAYFHYLLVDPEFQKQGIGKRLVELMLAEYRDYLRKTLIAYDKEIGFYQHCGFEVGLGKTPLSISILS